MKTVYLFQSHHNAKRLLDSLKRVNNKVNQPQILDSLNLRRKINLIMPHQKDRDLIFDQNFLDDLKFWTETNKKTAISQLDFEQQSRFNELFVKSPKLF